MEKYLYPIIGIVLLALCAATWKLSKDVKYYQAEIQRTTDNLRAYEAGNSSLEKENKLYKFTIDELQASKDSINQKLLAMAEKLKIKDKNIEALQYHQSVITKTDTVVLNDTIFKDRAFSLDTIVGDKWYTMKLGMKYPSTIVTSPTFTSEKYIIVNKKKEYNKEPSKIFFIRWFQRKHWVLNIEVKEENPYITNKEFRFIEIVK